MNTPFPKWLRGASAAALAVLGACTSATARTAPMPAPTSMADVYAKAMYDAALYEERDVLPLFPAIADAEGMVRVVTLTAHGYVRGTTTLGGDVWVSVVPEARDSCLSWSDDTDLVMRLRQLLGLRPADSVAHFVEMRAPAAGMFRPTVDPAIDTPTPCSAEQARLPGCGLSFPAGVDTAHITWMAGQMLSSWKMPDGYPRADRDPRMLGYPWTRLGYTYNWHPGSPRYGASEYLVRKGAPVTVTDVVPIPAYCGRV
ncbi:MAG TPA: hypothetical protein VF006_02320 [Longimicrobium sp.]